MLCRTIECLLLVSMTRLSESSGIMSGFMSGHAKVIGHHQSPQPSPNEPIASCVASKGLRTVYWSTWSSGIEDSVERSASQHGAKLLEKQYWKEQEEERPVSCLKPQDGVFGSKKKLVASRIGSEYTLLESSNNGVRFGSSKKSP